MSTRALCAASILLTVASIPALSGAHPGHADHGYASEDGADKQHEPTAEQKTKRLERVTRLARKRLKTREQRGRSDRIKLHKRLARHLEGAPITSDIKQELTSHARRVAQLRQIRFLAAANNDYDSVVAVDKALALENSRHERWWRTMMRRAKKKKGAQ